MACPCGHASLLLALFLLGARHCFAFDEVGELLCELLDTPAQEVDILVALLKEDLRQCRALALIAHVDDDQLIRLVFKAEELRYNLIAADVRGRVVNGLLNVIQLIVLWVPQIEQKELSVLGNSQHLGCIGHSRDLRCRLRNSCVRCHD